LSKSIRVSALAKELGMASKDVVDLCNRIGVGVTSASSTMVEAQADRASPRRRAGSEARASTRKAQASKEVG